MRAATVLLVLIAHALGAGGAAARAAGPTPHGTLSLSGALRDGSTVTATGVTWTAVRGSVQTISYTWSACAAACGPLATAVHQPDLPGVVLGSRDAGKQIFVRETATDVLPDGTTSVAGVTYRTSTAVAAWPAGTAPGWTSSTGSRGRERARRASGSFSRLPTRTRPTGR